MAVNVLLSVSNDIWIIGSSIIKRACDHTIQRPTGRHLGLDKRGFNVVWIGHPGMKWDSVKHLLYSMLTVKGHPYAIVIHCGGNDIVDNYNGSLLFQIRNDLWYLRTVMPCTLLIWSYILPRLFWLRGNDHDKVDKSRRRLNRGVRSFIVKFGGKAIQHLDFDDHHVSLFNKDNVHLSFIGSDIFLNAIQSGIELFITNPYRTIYPEEYR